MPEIFPLGDGKMYNGYLNRRLQHDQKYSIFVRAVVDTPQKVFGRVVITVIY